MVVRKTKAALFTGTHFYHVIRQVKSDENFKESKPRTQQGVGSISEVL